MKAIFRNVKEQKSVYVKEINGIKSAENLRNEYFEIVTDSEEKFYIQPKNVQEFQNAIDDAFMNNKCLICYFEVSNFDLLFNFNLVDEIEELRA